MESGIHLLGQAVFEADPRSPYTAKLDISIGRALLLRAGGTPMPAGRESMRKSKESLRLKFEHGLMIRAARL